LDNNMDMNSKSQAIQAKIEYIENYSNWNILHRKENKQKE
jgi:hypothetical protein